MSGDPKETHRSSWNVHEIIVTPIGIPLIIAGIHKPIQLETSVRDHNPCGQPRVIMTEIATVRMVGMATRMTMKEGEMAPSMSMIEGREMETGDRIIIGPQARVRAAAEVTELKTNHCSEI